MARNSFFNNEVIEVYIVYTNYSRYKIIQLNRFWCCFSAYKSDIAVKINFHLIHALFCYINSTKSNTSKLQAQKDNSIASNMEGGPTSHSSKQKDKQENPTEVVLNTKDDSLEPNSDLEEITPDDPFYIAFPPLEPLETLEPTLSALGTSEEDGTNNPSAKETAKTGGTRVQSSLSRFFQQPANRPNQNPNLDKVLKLLSSKADIEKGGDE